MLRGNSAAKAGEIAKDRRKLGRRRINARAGRGLELLSHAIEYLADEFALECLSTGTLALQTNHPTLAAIELLKERNRTVYYSCPLVPTLGERVWKLLTNRG
jgi:hypothetical protein